MLKISNHTPGIIKAGEEDAELVPDAPIPAITTQRPGESLLSFQHRREQERIMREMGLPRIVEQTPAPLALPSPDPERLNVIEVTLKVANIMTDFTTANSKSALQKWYDQEDWFNMYD